MSKSIVLFLEGEKIVVPPYDIPINNKMTYLINQYNSVKRAIQLSEKGFKGDLTDDESKEITQLFKDSNVLLLIDAAEKFARQRGWVYSQFYGGLTGGITQISFGTTINTNLKTMFSLILLGALIGGFEIEISTPDLVNTLNKFKEEDALSDYTTMIQSETLWKTN